MPLPAGTGRAFKLAIALPLAIAASAALREASGAGSPGTSGLKELTVVSIYGGELSELPPTGFTWSPDGSRVAFTRSDAPDRPPLLYVLDPASRRATTLTSQTQGAPDKLEVSSFTWAPRGDAILIGSKGDLYLLQLASGSGSPPQPRRLTSTEAEETDSKISPDGTMIGYVREHNLFAMDLASGSERRLTGGDPEGVNNGEVDWVYEEEFEISSGWWWSPDSTRIAYLQFDERSVPTYPILDWIPTHPETSQQRYPKAGDPNPVVRVGVVEARGPAAAAGTPPRTRWIHLGSDTDIYIPRVSWTADGSRLAVQRLDRDQAHLELLLCDPATGVPRTLLEERNPQWINISDDWRFLPGGEAGDRLIWGSERDGHRHLYLYALDGRLIRRLTQGAWSVTELSAVDEKGGWVYFMATEKDPRERHLYRVRMDGSGLGRITREDGWHTTWVAGDGAAFVDSHSTFMAPPSVTLRRASGEALQMLDEGMAKELSRYRRGRGEFRSAPAADGTQLPAMITLPPDFDPSRRYPVLLFVYGGPRAQTVTSQWDRTRGLWHQMMASRGFIVWTLDNRGTTARGHAWEAPIYRRMGQQEMADQLAGVAYLKTLPYVDASRIGIWGWSYGGYMTLYCLVNSPETFVAGVAVAPVTDWKDYDTIYTERYMDRPSDNQEGYRDSSPLQKAASLRAPLLLIHGSSDDNVHMQNSVQILEAFVEAGVPVDFMLYPRKNHRISGKEARTHLFEKITRFLTDNVMKEGRAR